MKVTVPVGLNPAETLAESVTEPPTKILELERVVESVGAILVTIRVSEPQALEI